MLLDFPSRVWRKQSAEQFPQPGGLGAVSAGTVSPSTYTATRATAAVLELSRKPRFPSHSSRNCPEFCFFPLSEEIVVVVRLKSKCPGLPGTAQWLWVKFSALEISSFSVLSEAADGDDG